MTIAQQSIPTASDSSSVRYVVIVGLCLAATIAYIGRNCLGVASTSIATELKIPLIPMGWVMGTFFWSYALAQIPAGWLGHVWGSRLSLALYATVWSVACAAMGLSSGIWSLIAAQLFFGIGQAGLFPCAAAVISNWLPNSRRAIASGLLGAFQSVGGAIGSALTGALLAGLIGVHIGDQFYGIQFSAIGWRWVYLLYAFPGFFWAAWFLYWFRDNPAEHPGVNDEELQVIGRANQRSGSAEPTPWKLVVTSLDMWMIFGQQFFRGAGYIFFATWFPKFLQESRNVSIEAAGALTALPLLGVVAGCPIGGIIADYIFNRTGSRNLSRRLVAFLAMITCGGFILTAYFISEPILAVLVITAGSFSAALGGSCGYTVTIDKGGRHVAPVFGAMNMCGNLGAAGCPVVVAWIVDRTGQWNIVLVFFALVYAAAAACWAFLNPEGTLEDRPAG